MVVGPRCNSGHLHHSGASWEDLGLIILKRPVRLRSPQPTEIVIVRVLCGCPMKLKAENYVVRLMPVRGVTSEEVRRYLRTAVKQWAVKMGEKPVLRPSTVTVRREFRY